MENNELHLTGGIPSQKASLAPQPASLTFHADQDGEAVEMIKLTKGTFYFKGEPVEDKNEVYERFCEWMAMAQKK